jgi:hypothetical protein
MVGTTVFNPATAPMMSTTAAHMATITGTTETSPRSSTSDTIFPRHP